MVDKLIIRKNVSLDYNEDDWDLFNMRDSNLAAKVLNETFEQAVNTGLNRRETEIEMHKVMGQYKDFGAYDSEPIRVLDRLLEKVYR